MFILGLKFNFAKLQKVKKKYCFLVEKLKSFVLLEVNSKENPYLVFCFPFNEVSASPIVVAIIFIPFIWSVIVPIPISTIKCDSETL